MAWADIIGRHSQKITYVDLFAGKGTHKSGEHCTAIQVMQLASKEKLLLDNLRIVLNDKKTKYYRELMDLIETMGFNDRFTRGIKLYNVDAIKLAQELVKLRAEGPMFCFIDPYSFRGLSSEIVRIVIGSWGSECLLFFATSAINRNLKRSDCEKHFLNIFPRNILEKLRVHSDQDEKGREEVILEEFVGICRGCGAEFVLPFQVNIKSTERKSHHLIYMTKHFRGFAIMKEIMANESTSIDTIPTYKYKGNSSHDAMPLELGLEDSPMEKLKSILLEDFKGQKIAVKDILDACHKKGYIYTVLNIKKALEYLDVENRLIDLTEKPRRKNTFGKSRIVKFPS